MLDVERTEAAERELNRFIESRAESRRVANEEVARQREIDLKRLAAMRSENRDAWITHLRRVAGAHLKAARGARARARALEAGES